MKERFGVILLDGNEIIFKIYRIDRYGNWKLVKFGNYDLTTFSERPVTAYDFIEIVRIVFQFPEAAFVTSWHMCTRNVAEELVEEVAKNSDIPTEYLTLSREQELICKGILMEI